MTYLSGSGMQGKFSKLTTTSRQTPSPKFTGKIEPATKCSNPSCPLDGFIKMGQVRVTEDGNSYHFKCEPKNKKSSTK